MDIGDNYEAQQQQQQEQQQQQQQQQQMQCDPIYTTATTTTPSAITTYDFDSANSSIAAVAGPALTLAPDTIAAATTMMMDISTTLGNNTTPHILTPSSNNIAIPLPPPPTPTVTPASTPTKSSVSLPMNELDIDSILLQQFSCMGTTDHDDLISQFQELMNNQMNRDSAKFYLEMSNWNLQTAICCYLDFCSLQSLPSMKILQRSQANAIQHGWRLLNDGTERWPNGCYLMSPNQAQRLNLPSLRQGETCDIIADIMPNQPAIMWRLCTPNGWYFGESIWMIPPGMQPSVDELQQRMSQLVTSDTNLEGYPQMNVVISANTQ